MLDGSGQASVRHGRLPWPRPSELDPSQRAVYDAITGGPRSAGPQAFALTDDEGRLEGPFNALLIAPQLGLALQEVGAALRYRTALTDRQRELAILEVARAHRSGFEWYAHMRVGSLAGLTAAELEAVRNGQGCPSLSADEALLRAVVSQLLSSGDLTDESFALANERFGIERIQEILVIVGYYELLALLLRVWRVPLPRGAEPVFTGDEG